MSREARAADASTPRSAGQAADASTRSAGQAAGASTPRGAGQGAGETQDGARRRRRETTRLLLWLAADLLSIPFHLALFAFTRSRHRRAFRRALENAAP